MIKTYNEVLIDFENTRNPELIEALMEMELNNHTHAHFGQLNGMFLYSSIEGNYYVKK